MFTKPAQNTTVNRSLILAGGGMRVAYQAGVLIALEEAGLEFFHVDGTSGGIFNTAMLASGQSPKSMANKWRKLKPSFFVSGRKAKSYLKPFKMQGYADADNIRNKVFPALGISLTQIQKSNKAHATFNICNFSKKKIEAINAKEVTEDHLIAGVSLPIFMPAIKIGGDWYTDAVWIKDANLVEAVNQGADELWLIWAIGNVQTYLKGAFHQYVHMIEMSANGGLLEEYKQIKLLDQIRRKEKPTKLFVIKSPIPLPLDPDFFFNRINARELINMGYSHAKGILLNQSQTGYGLNEKTTQSTEPDYILSFRGVYDGSLECNGETVTVKYYLFQRYCQFKKEDILETYSSIQIGPGEEIAAYGHQLMKPSNDSMPVRKTNAQFHWKNEKHTLTTSQNMGGPLEIFVGLAFKQICLSLKDNEGRNIGGGILYQSLGNRLKSRYYSSINTTLPKGVNLKTKLKLIKNYTEYGF